MSISPTSGPLQAEETVVSSSPQAEANPMTETQETGMHEDTAVSLSQEESVTVSIDEDEEEEVSMTTRDSEAAEMTNKKDKREEHGASQSPWAKFISMSPISSSSSVTAAAAEKLNMESTSAGNVDIQNLADDGRAGSETKNLDGGLFNQDIVEQPKKQSVSSDTTVLLRDSDISPDNKLKAQLKATEAKLAAAQQQVNKLQWQKEVSVTEQIKIEDRLKMKIKEVNALLGRNRKLEDNLMLANNRQSQLNLPVAKLLSQQSAKAEKYKKEIDALKRRLSDLFADLESERDRADRLQAQLMERQPALRLDQADSERGGDQSPSHSLSGSERKQRALAADSEEQQKENRGLMTELRATRESLMQSTSYLWRARSQIKQLQLDRCSSVGEFLQEYGHGLDPCSKIFDTMRHVANYCDEVAEEPSKEVADELKLFETFLLERTQLLRDIMNREDPTDIMEAFGAKWGEAVLDNDWGSNFTRNEVVVKETAKILLAKKVNREDAVLETESKVKERFEGSYSDDVIDRFVGLQDEINQAQRRNGKTRGSGSTTPSWLG
ncbi:hypothetical protein BD289DRAFT_479785 [Coniella lustricola]|uniref:Uncharacterized protein n=1 Tax=Coniella lustricola TaxID=2025994 RepID=A0A2T3AHW9_9PEZI|nr:hypothetical protein BD289DRAFT_479785 [Coniella lustricola]